MNKQIIKSTLFTLAGFAFGYWMNTMKIERLEDENHELHSLYQSLSPTVDYDYHLELEPNGKITVINYVGEVVTKTPLDSLQRVIELDNL